MALWQVSTPFTRIAAATSSSVLPLETYAARSPFASNLDGMQGAMPPVAAAAVVRPGKRPTVCLAWEVAVSDPVLEARQKPLELVAYALTHPHPRSLSAALRARGLSPLEVELDPIVVCKTVARAEYALLASHPLSAAFMLRRIHARAPIVSYPLPKYRAALRQRSPA